MSENLLIDLCEPYLLELIELLSQCLRRISEDPLEVAQDNNSDISDAIVAQIASLDYLQRAEVLAAAANHVLAIAQRNKEARGLPPWTSPNSELQKPNS